MWVKDPVCGAPEGEDRFQADCDACTTEPECKAVQNKYQGAIDRKTAWCARDFKSSVVAKTACDQVPLCYDDPDCDRRTAGIRAQAECALIEEPDLQQQCNTRMPACSRGDAPCLQKRLPDLLDAYKRFRTLKSPDCSDYDATLEADCKSVKDCTTIADCTAQIDSLKTLQRDLYCDRTFPESTVYAQQCRSQQPPCSQSDCTLKIPAYETFQKLRREFEIENGFYAGTTERVCDDVPSCEAKREQVKTAFCSTTPDVATCLAQLPPCASVAKCKVLADGLGLTSGAAPTVEAYCATKIPDETTLQATCIAEKCNPTLSTAPCAKVFADHARFRALTDARYCSDTFTDIAKTQCENATCDSLASCEQREAQSRATEGHQTSWNTVCATFAAFPGFEKECRANPVRATSNQDGAKADLELEFKQLGQLVTRCGALDADSDKQTCLAALATCPNAKKCKADIEAFFTRQSEMLYKMQFCKNDLDPVALEKMCKSLTESDLKGLSSKERAEVQLGRNACAAQSIATWRTKCEDLAMVCATQAECVDRLVKAGVLDLAAYINIRTAAVHVQQLALKTEIDVAKAQLLPMQLAQLERRNEEAKRNQASFAAEPEEGEVLEDIVDIEAIRRNPNSLESATILAGAIEAGDPDFATATALKAHITDVLKKASLLQEEIVDLTKLQETTEKGFRQDVAVAKIPQLSMTQPTKAVTQEQKRALAQKEYQTKAAMFRSVALPMLEYVSSITATQLEDTSLFDPREADLFRSVEKRDASLADTKLTPTKLVAITDGAIPDVEDLLAIKPSPGAANLHRAVVEFAVYVMARGLLRMQAEFKSDPALLRRLEISCSGTLRGTAYTKACTNPAAFVAAYELTRSKVPERAKSPVAMYTALGSAAFAVPNGGVAATQEGKAWETTKLAQLMVDLEAARITHNLFTTEGAKTQALTNASLHDRIQEVLQPSLRQYMDPRLQDYLEFHDANTILPAIRQATNAYLQYCKDTHDDPAQCTIDWCKATSNAVCNASEVQPTGKKSLRPAIASKPPPDFEQEFKTCVSMLTAIEEDFDFDDVKKAEAEITTQRAKGVVRTNDDWKSNDKDVIQNDCRAWRQKRETNYTYCKAEQASATPRDGITVATDCTTWQRVIV